jgi:SNF2-related domain
MVGDDPDILFTDPAITPSFTPDKEELTRSLYRLDERCRIRPYTHQVIGIDKLVTHPFFALFDEMGAGKTLQCVVAAGILLLEKKINRVVVIAPAAVRAVWYDQEMGEITKHLPRGIHGRVVLFHSRSREWRIPETEGSIPSEWIVTNYEILRQQVWLSQLLPHIDNRTLLILDESSLIKSWKAEQTKAVREIRKRAGRCWMLNGTPVANNPLDLFSQGLILHEGILSSKFITHFKANYCIMGGYEVTLPNGRKMATQITGWRNLKDLTRRFAPYVLRRLKTDCLDLPPKLDPVIIPVPLEETTWKHYKAMRDDMVAWLSDSTVTMSHQSMTKIMRLAQITSGFIGGVERLEDEIVDGEPFCDPLDELIEGDDQYALFVEARLKSAATESIQWISREKLDALIDWVTLLLEADPALKLLVWCRFRPEVIKATEAFRKAFPSMEVANLRGGQPKEEERDALRLLDPRYAPAGAATLFTTSKGTMGFSFTASHTVAKLSRDYSLWRWLQGDDRVHRPGQTKPISYTDFVATGPRGQKTVDLEILKALLAKLDLAKATTEEWRSMLAGE